MKCNGRSATRKRAAYLPEFGKEKAEHAAPNLANPKNCRNWANGGRPKPASCTANNARPATRDATALPSGNVPAPCQPAIRMRMPQRAHSCEHKAPPHPHLLARSASKGVTYSIHLCDPASRTAPVFCTGAYIRLRPVAGTADFIVAKVFQTSLPLPDVRPPGEAPGGSLLVS